MSLPTVAFFPVFVPNLFKPMDPENDGTDLSWKGEPCPCQSGDYRPAWGGGFDAGRVREGKTLAHRAIDIMGAQGSHILSIGPGKVAETWRPGPGRLEPGAGHSEKGGHYVVIDETLPDGSQWRWYYAHLALTPGVKPGDMVKAGQMIGVLGRTGNATKKAKDGSYYGCPHLHLALTGSNDKALRSAREKGLKVAGGKVDSVPLLKPLFDAGRWKHYNA